MSTFVNTGDGVAAIIFLVLYVLLLLATVNITRIEGWFLVYGFLVVVTLFGFGTSLCNVVHATPAHNDLTPWLISGRIMAAQGYVFNICLLFFYVSRAQTREFGFLTLKPSGKQQVKMYGIFGCVSWRVMLYTLVLAADTAIMYSLVDVICRDPSGRTKPRYYTTARVVGTVGYSLLLVVLFKVMWFAVDGFLNLDTKKQPDFLLALILAPLLAVHAVYGILEIFLVILIPYAETKGGIAIRYLMGMMTMFIAAAVMVSFYYIGRLKKLRNREQLYDSNPREVATRTSVMPRLQRSMLAHSNRSWFGMWK